MQFSTPFHSISITFAVYILLVILFLFVSVITCTEVVEPDTTSITHHHQPTSSSSHHHHHPILQTPSITSKEVEYSSENKRQEGENDNGAKVHIYILAGQSNMEGHGEIDKRDDDTGLLKNGTLLYQLHDPRTRKEFQILWDDSKNDWKSLEHVQIWFQQALYEAGVNGTKIPGVNGQDYSAGDLTVGYGEGGSARGEFFGPELGFGFHLKLPPGSSPNDKILLVKTAWGGKDLAQDFRPPSSAQQYDPFCWLPECDPFSVGHYFNVMLQDVNKLLRPGVLSDIFPDQYNGNMTLEVAGFGWFQGWNDGCSVNYTAAYETNLVHLIQDIRHALKKPKLPVVIGVSGFEGWRDNGQGRHPPNCWDGPNIIDRIHCDCSGFDRDCRRIDIMLSQIAAANLTKHPELDCCVKAIETRDFFRPVEFSPVDQGYHFNHNAETHYLIGKAMAKGMNQIIQEATSDVHERNSEPVVEVE